MAIIKEGMDAKVSKRDPPAMRRFPVNSSRRSRRVANENLWFLAKREGMVQNVIMHHKTNQ